MDSLCNEGTDSCDDSDLCTIDSCNPVDGCLNTPVECPEGEQCNPDTEDLCEEGLDADCDVVFDSEGPGMTTFTIEDISGWGCKQIV